VQIAGFLDPLRVWVEVQGSGVPPWRRDLLREEERGPNSPPPSPPKVDKSLVSYLAHFDHEVVGGPSTTSMEVEGT